MVKKHNTGAGYFINTVKTTFGYNLDFYQAFKQP